MEIKQAQLDKQTKKQSMVKKNYSWNACSQVRERSVAQLWRTALPDKFNHWKGKHWYMSLGVRQRTLKYFRKNWQALFGGTLVIFYCW